jgi:hypothetical protein
MSGFIDLNGFNGTPFELFENNNVENDKGNNMTGTLGKSKLSELYFSQSNIDLLQDYIISGVFRNTSTKICKQSEDELLIIMRSIFLQHAKHLDYNFQEQINELNNYVLDYSIKNIESSIKQYNGYIENITKERSVMNMPQSVSVKGDKTLMPRHFI